MFSQYFGQYLLNKQLLTAEQLTDAMALERLVRVKLGVLAINAGMMTAQQVEEVHELQRTKDKRFGELAIEKGYLTFSQLEDLLQIQGSRHLSLSQAIIDRGYMDLAQLEIVLERYKEESSLSSEQLQAIQTVNFDEASRAFLDFSAAGGMGEVYHDYVSLILRNIVRFLGDEPMLFPNVSLVEKGDGWVFTQSITGEMDLFTGFIMNDAVLLAVARCYSQEDLTEVDELARDSVAEFLNLANGIFCINASDKGLNLNLEPQKLVRDGDFKQIKGYKVPIQMSAGKFDLIIGCKK